MQNALFQGRFQPPSIAQASTAETILNTWPFLVICVVYDSPKPDWLNPKWNEYLAEAARTSYAPGKNPFAPHEIKEMWDAWISFRSFCRRIRCDISKRPYFDREFNKRYPPEEFMIVRPARKEGDADIDSLRGKIFPELLKREYTFVHPPFKLHNTEIIRRVMEEGKSWESFIPPGAYEVFLRIQGPARIEDAYRNRLLK